MLFLENLILNTYGHSNDALGLVTIPTLIFTLMIALLAFLVPGKYMFWLGVWCIAGMIQTVGVLWARKIRLKQNKPV